MFVSIGKIPFIHVGNQVVSELGPIVQFTKAKASVVQMKAVIVSFGKFSSSFSQ